MDVRELMTAPVYTVYDTDTLNCAAKMMSEGALGCIPVIDERGVLIGVLTDRDIALAAPDDDIDQAAHTMRQYRVRRLPVVDGQSRPIGMLSLDDLVHASRQPILDPTPGMTTDEITDTVQAVSGRSRHPRPAAH